jgi:S-adenosylmethionine/arginine decarboxylase-like enzyme
MSKTSDNEPEVANPFITENVFVGNTITADQVDTPLIVTDRINPLTGSAIILGGSFSPTPNDTLTCGTSGNQYNTVFGKFIGSNTTTCTLQSTVSTTAVIGATGVTVQATANDVTITAPSGAINVTAPTGILPTIDNTVDLGILARTFKNVFARSVVGHTASPVTLGSPTIGAQLNSLTITPITNDIYTCGTSVKQFNTVFSKFLGSDTTDCTVATVGALNLSCASSINVVAPAGIVPVTTNVVDLGSSSKLFKSIYATEMGAIIQTRDMRPTTDNLYDVGNATFNYSTMHSKTFRSSTALTVLATTALNLTGPTSMVLSTPAVTPLVTTTTDLGSTSLYYKNVYAQNYESQQAFKADAGYVRAIMARTASTLTATTLTAIAFNAFATTNFFAVNNANFKVLVKGMYQVSFTSSGDTGGGADNNIYYDVYNTTLASSMTSKLFRHTIGLLVAPTHLEESKIITFTFEITNITENYQIRVARTTLDVTNWEITNGSITLLQAYA